MLQKTPPTREALVVDVFHDVLHPALENAAEIVNAGGGEGEVFPHPGEAVAAHPVLVDEDVGRDPLALEGLPKGPVGDHSLHLKDYFILWARY